MRRVVVALVVLLAILHQDFWFWDRIEPLVFGFIPIGLAYHIGVSLAAGVLWALAVRFCWPADVDIPDEPSFLKSPASDNPRARA